MAHQDREASRYVGRHFRKRARRRMWVPAVAVVALVLAAVTFGIVRASRHSRLAVPPAVPSAGPRPAASASNAPVSNASVPIPPGSQPGAALTAGGTTAVTSPAITAENLKPGTTAWRITHQPPTGFIEGFADTTYAAAGQTVGLYVSTSAPTFVVRAYRMGWYGGLGGREVWASTAISGVRQPPCPVDHQTNMVSCDNWSESLAVPITSDFMQGDYLLKLVGSGGEQGYILLTVWDPSSTAAYLVMARSLTEEGWNTYGGYDFYQGEGPCILGQTGSYPACNRARVVSFDRPDATNYGASDFLSNEFPLVQLMEKEGLDAAYCTDITVDEHPDIVLAHRAVLSLGHDETWTYNERKAAQAGLAHGVNFFFGAASVLRHSRLQPSPLGPDREEVDYRDSGEDPLYRQGGDPMNVTGNTWGSPPASWSEIPFVGQEYSGYLFGVDSVPMVIADASSWIFQGTGLQNGSSIPGVVMSDFDHLDPSGGSPPNVDVLAHSPVPLSESFTSQGEWGGQTYSDMTYYTDPTSGAGVVDTGTVNWIHALTPCSPGPQSCAAPVVTTITENILRVFGQGPAGREHPSVGNWQSIRPYGS